MQLICEAIPAFSDNYFWLLHNQQQAVVVDPGAAAPVINKLQQHNLQLCAILITHHHADHTGGLSKLLQNAAVPVYGPANKSITNITHSLHQGDTVHISELDADFEILEIPGHTADHIAYYGDRRLFCGDTLFCGGCGRLFEGTPEQMYHSLQKLAALPSDTHVYCAHEYTLANLNFALSVDNENLQLQQRLRQTEQLRQSGLITVPSTLADEIATNPFLRCHTPALKQAG